MRILVTKFPNSENCRKNFVMVHDINFYNYLGIQNIHVRPLWQKCYMHYRKKNLGVKNI